MSLVRSGDVVGAASSDRTIPRGGKMAELREYVVVLNGNETTMQLTEDDAKELDGKLVEGAAKPEGKPAESKAVPEPPQHKARSPKGR